MPIDESAPEFVDALKRGLAVIRCFGEGAEELTMTEVATKAGLTRAGARRLLLTLEALGYVRLENKRFRLTPRSLDLGYAYLSSIPIWKVAQPIMKDVTDELNELCSIGVLDGTDLVYIARVPPKHMMLIPVNLGTRIEAYVNSMGRVLLAHLPPTELDSYFANVTLRKYTSRTITDEKRLRGTLREIEKAGYAILDEELQDGRRSIAVPIIPRVGAVQVAINASADATRATTQDLLKRYLPVLRSAADKISHAV